MSFPRLRGTHSRREGEIGAIREWVNDHFMLVVLGPSLAVLGSLVVLPLFYLVQTSMVQTTFTTTEFVGLQNYRIVLTDPAFYNALQVTLIYMVGTTTLAFTIGFIIALALNQFSSRRFRAPFLTAVLLAWAVPQIVGALVWRFMLNSQYGLINAILIEFGIVSEGIAFLSDPTWAMVLIILADSWARAPFAMIILLAGLQTIPQHLYEAATVDGATDFMKFRDITLPNIKGSAGVALLIMSMFSFRTFSIAFGLTKGGPGGATELLAILVYQAGITELRLGYAAAISVIMILITVFFITIYVYVMQEDAVQTA
jgi:multiple sugar transport system permease protein